MEAEAITTNWLTVTKSSKQSLTMTTSGNASTEHAHGSRAQETEVATLCRALPGPGAGEDAKLHTCDCRGSPQPFVWCQIVSSDLDVTLLHVL